MSSADVKSLLQETDTKISEEDAARKLGILLLLSISMYIYIHKYIYIYIYLYIHKAKYLATTFALLIDNLEFNFSAPVLSV